MALKDRESEEEFLQAALDCFVPLHPLETLLLKDATLEEIMGELKRRGLSFHLTFSSVDVASEK